MQTTLLYHMSPSYLTSITEYVNLFNYDVGILGKIGGSLKLFRFIYKIFLHSLSSLLSLFNLEVVASFLYVNDHMVFTS